MFKLLTEDLMWLDVRLSTPLIVSTIPDGAIADTRGAYLVDANGDFLIALGV